MQSTSELNLDDNPAYSSSNSSPASSPLKPLPPTPPTLLVRESSSNNYETIPYTDYDRLAVKGVYNTLNYCQRGVAERRGQRHEEHRVLLEEEDAVNEPSQGGVARRHGQIREEDAINEPSQGGVAGRRGQVKEEEAINEPSQGGVAGRRGQVKEEEEVIKEGEDIATKSSTLATNREDKVEKDSSL